MSFEAIVRPFQNGQVFNSRAANNVAPLAAGEFTSETADADTTTWKGGADASWVEIPSQFIPGINFIEDPASRVTETIKVTNPDDDSQHIMLERIKAATFVNTGTGQRMPISMRWDDGRR